MLGPTLAPITCEPQPPPPRLPSLQDLHLLDATPHEDLAQWESALSFPPPSHLFDPGELSPHVSPAVGSPPFRCCRRSYTPSSRVIRLLSSILSVIRVVGTLPPVFCTTACAASSSNTARVRHSSATVCFAWPTTPPQLLQRRLLCQHCRTDRDQAQGRVFCKHMELILAGIKIDIPPQIDRRFIGRRTRAQLEVRPAMST